MTDAVCALAARAVPVPVPVTGAGERTWQVYGHEDHPIVGRLPRSGSGPAAVAVVLGAAFRPGDNADLLRGIETARIHRQRFVLVHLGAGGAAMVRSASAEDPALTFLSIELPRTPSGRAIDTAVALVNSEWHRTDELRVDAAGGISAPVWRPVGLPATPAAPDRTGQRELAVITGGLGGLGIRAAGVLAHRHGLHPVLVDRASPDDLRGASARHLRCLAGGRSGVTVRRADVTDEHAVAVALRDLPGEVVTVLHCAGVLSGGPISSYTPGDLAAAQAVKVAGLRHVLGALDRRTLRQLLVFGSITAEWPHRHLGCYALANELLRREALRLAAGLPRAATVVAQWSVWAGAGIAHDLGAVPQARRMGLVPISLRAGMATLSRLLALPAGPDRAAVLMLTGGPGPAGAGPERVPA